MSTNRKSNQKSRNGQKREQPRKDSRTKRVNYDNERVEKFDRDMKRCDGNDISWYNRNPQMFASSTSIPMSTVTGEIIDHAYDNSQTMAAVPGVMQIRFNPSLGSDTTAINQSKDATYSFTVHANSRNKSYNSADEMMVILAGAQYFACLAMGIRAYGLMRRYDPINSYLPEALVKACGFDFADLKSNLPNMWFDLNQHIAASRQIWIPNEFPVIDRWFWLNTNIYMDAGNSKGQYYVFAQEYFWYYNETINEQGGGLSAVRWLPKGSTTYNTWSEYLELLGQLEDALLNSEDRGVIMGDMLKAYGAEKMYHINEITSEYYVEPTYNEEVLCQIENATVCEHALPNVVQEQNTLQIGYDYVTNASAIANPTGTSMLPDWCLLNLHNLNPTNEQIMIATRLAAVGSSPIISSDGTEVIGVHPTYAGTEIVTGITVLAYYLNSGVPKLGQIYINLKSYNTTAAVNLNSRDIAYWTAFDWAPWMATYHVGTALPTKILPSNWKTYLPDAFIAYFGDWDNWTILEDSVLRKLHVTAIYSEFGVPTYK